MNEDGCEMLAWYFGRGLRGRGRSPGDTGLAVLDPMDPEIIGKAHVKELRRAAKAGGLGWMGPAFRQVVEGWCPLTKPRPQGLTEVRVSSRIDLGKLEDWGVLVEYEGRRQAWCGLFSVPKKGGVDRVIFDARPANQLTASLGGFRLFLLEELLGLVGGMLGEGVIFVSKDFRHFFYQVPLPTSGPLVDLFVIRTSEEGSCLRPRVLCMGYHNAPVIAETISWMTVLFREPDEDSLGVRHEELQALEMMPPYVLLYDAEARVVGAIFIIIDNILVATTSPTMAHLWNERLRRNSKKFHVVFKEETGPEIREDGVTFAGVEFNTKVGGWRPADVETLGITHGPMKLRKVASWLGSLYWRLRVMRVDLCHVRRVVDMSRRLGVIAAETSKDGWNRFITLTKEDAEALGEVEKLTQGRGDEDWIHPHLDGGPPLSRYCRVAVDATPYVRAWCFLSPEGNLRGEIKVVRSKIPLEIDLQELSAMLDAITDDQVADEQFFLIAGDSEVARHVVLRRHSGSQRLDEKMIEISNTKKRITPFRVTSAENVADTPTRTPEICIEEHRLNLTHAAFSRFLASNK